MSNEKTKPKFEKTSEWLNAMIRNILDMNNEVLAMKDHVELTVTNFDEKIDSLIEKMDELENRKKREMVIQDKKMQELTDLEKAGYSLSTDKTLIAHILTTNQLIFEEMGKIRNTLQTFNDGIKELDRRTTDFAMSQQLMGEKVNQLVEVQMRVHENNTKTISRLVKIVALAIAEIAVLVGLDTLFNAGRFIQ